MSYTEWTKPFHGVSHRNTKHALLSVEEYDSFVSATFMPKPLSFVRFDSRSDFTTPDEAKAWLEARASLMTVPE